MGYLCGILAIVFTTLKLIGEIDWEWVWVLAPLWGYAVLCFVVAVFVITAREMTKTKHERMLERRLAAARRRDRSIMARWR